ncbi:MAG: hypothetical protein WB476_02045, partial [Azonexus sp.]
MKFKEYSKAAVKRANGISRPATTPEGGKGMGKGPGGKRGQGRIKVQRHCRFGHFLPVDRNSLA